jgi:hypothetical protein
MPDENKPAAPRPQARPSPPKLSDAIEQLREIGQSPTGDRLREIGQSLRGAGQSPNFRAMAEQMAKYGEGLRRLGQQLNEQREAAQPIQRRRSKRGNYDTRQRGRALRAILKLWPNGIPPKSELTNSELCEAVEKELVTPKDLPSRKTILRAVAGQEVNR